MAIHAGEIIYDEHGVTAAAVNFTCRLLEASELKHQLRNSSGELTLIVSEWIREEVVRHGDSDRLSAYRQVPVVVKETDTTGWMLADVPADRNARGRAAPSKWWHGIRRPRIWAPLTGCFVLVVAAAVWYAFPHDRPFIPVPHEIACKPPLPQERDENIKLEVNNLVEATYRPCLDHRDNVRS